MYCTNMLIYIMRSITHITAIFRYIINFFKIIICRSEFYTIFKLFSKFGLILTKEWMRFFFISTNPYCIPANFSTISSILGDISIASFVRLAILMMSLFFRCHFFLQSVSVLLLKNRLFFVVGGLFVIHSCS